MADVVVTVVNLSHLDAAAEAPADISSPDAITTGQSWEIDVDGLSDRVILILEKTDANAITITPDQPTPNGFSMENLPAIASVTPASAGEFVFGPFETSRFKHNVDAGADAGKITGTSAGTLTAGTLIALAMPKGAG